jgi:hypothetical protein
MKRIEVEELPPHGAVGTEQPDETECLTLTPCPSLHGADHDRVERRHGHERKGAPILDENRLTRTRTRTWRRRTARAWMRTSCLRVS